LETTQFIVKVLKAWKRGYLTDEIDFDRGKWNIYGLHNYIYML